MAAKPRDNCDDLDSVLTRFFKDKETASCESCSLNLLITSEDNIFIWIHDKKQVLVIPMKNVFPTSSCKANPDQILQFQKLNCSQICPFDVTSMQLSLCEQFLSLCGDHGVCIMEMPKQWGRTSLYAGGKSNLVCRSTLLADEFFRKRPNVKVLQASWFPGSLNDSHILVLTSDNCLRCFDVTQAAAPLSTIKLFDSLNTSNRSSTMSFAAVLGEVAVSFSFAPPVAMHGDANVYPIFVTQENGDTWTLWSKLSHKIFLANQVGPLCMTPSAEDNYGGDFTAILCLQTSPPVIVLSTIKGAIYHCIVLESEQEERGLEAEHTQSESTINSSELELFVYETVQLDMTLLKLDETDQSQVDENFRLFQDTSVAHRYYCVSSGGIHMVNLPWVEDLENFCSPASIEAINDGEISRPAEISYILCTRPTEKSPPYRILGATTTTSSENGTSLICLLENGELITRGITNTAEKKLNETVMSEEERSYSAPRFPSPLKRLKATGAFDEYIKQIIKRDGSTPLIKGDSANQDLSSEEFYQLLTQATRYMREEYIEKMNKAHNEIKKRCEILKTLKDDQLEDLSRILRNNELSDNAQRLGDKLLTISENMAALTERLDDVVVAVQSSSPVLSDAEREWSQECKSLQDKVTKLNRDVEGVRRKHENLTLATLPSKKVKSPKGQLNPGQLVKVKTYLKEQNNQIAELVDRVKTIDLQLES